MKESLSNLFLLFLTALERIMSFRVRLLPIVIFSAAILLTVKISVLWKNVDTFMEISRAEAEEAKEAEKKDPPKADGAEEKKSSEPMQGIDPFNMTQEQYDAWEEVTKKNKEKETNKSNSTHQEATLTAIQKKIEEKTKSLAEAQEKLEGLLKKVDEKEKVNTERLVKMIESMKPEEASKVLEAMDFSILMDLMEAIKPAKASKILESMEHEKAAYLMNELAKRRKLIKNEKVPEVAEN